MTGTPNPRSFWLLTFAVLCGVGMWSYTDRVLIPHQVADARLRDQPRGNLSDLYPRWIGAKDLLLYGRDPYSADVTREIQIGYYGRALDPSRKNDPTDEQGFAYPVYVVFGLAPAVRLSFAVVQRSFFWILVLVTAVSSALWLRVLRRSVSWSEQLILMVLTLGNVAVMQGLKLQQISLLVAALIAFAIMLLVSDYAVAAGAILAVATIKPQLMVLLLGWLALWALADWRRRYRLAVSFLATMVILIAASEWYLPHWIERFWHAVIEYQRYTGAMSVLEKAVGRPWSWILEILALAALAGACWKERRAPADSGAFASTFTFTSSLVLATTVLVIPTYAPYNQVLLVPALLLLVRDRRAIWQRSMANRVLVVIVTGLCVWPSIASTALAGLSYVLPMTTVDTAWSVPLRMLTQIPVGVAALMLIHYYQMTFNKPARPGAS
ncbi:MAG TPA: glycosyltransferase family 87 protein [Terriglobales bacterium]|nr:glycosyltransferase family 87 protein [Terriglobales bacterium]